MLSDILIKTSYLLLVLNYKEMHVQMRSICIYLWYRELRLQLQMINSQHLCIAFCPWFRLIKCPAARSAYDCSIDRPCVYHILYITSLLWYISMCSLKLCNCFAIEDVLVECQRRSVSVVSRSFETHGTPEACGTHALTEACGIQRLVTLMVLLRLVALMDLPFFLWSHEPPEALRYKVLPSLVAPMVLLRLVSLQLSTFVVSWCSDLSPSYSLVRFESCSRHFLHSVPVPSAGNECVRKSISHGIPCSCLASESNSSQPWKSQNPCLV